ATGTLFASSPPPRSLPYVLVAARLWLLPGVERDRIACRCKRRGVNALSAKRWLASPPIQANDRARHSTPARHHDFARLMKCYGSVQALALSGETVADPPKFAAPAFNRIG